jgi:YbbR domain-containing protein
VVQVLPAQLSLTFDTPSSREVEIHPRVTGIADGDQVKVEADPPRVNITGPRHHIEKIAEATTDAIDASAVKGSGVFMTSVYVSDPLVQVQMTSVRVTVRVQRAANPQDH